MIADRRKAETDQLLELWTIRFERLLRLETEAYVTYHQLLKKYSHLLAGTTLKRLIREVARTEVEHIRIAQRLLEIVQKKRHSL